MSTPTLINDALPQTSPEEVLDLPETLWPGLIEDDQLIVKRERELLFGKAAPGAKVPHGTALAFSGGGIRSASFGLGVLQALANAQCFDKFDYLSTVSGGGYLGAAISWLQKKTGANFLLEFGSAAVGARTCESAQKVDASAANATLLQGLKLGWQRMTHVAPAASTPLVAEATEQEVPHVWLDYLRQHGNYLKPSTISSLALVGNALRGALFNLTIYGMVVAVFLAFLLELKLLPLNEGVAWLDAPPLTVGSWRVYVRVESFALLVGLLFVSSITLYGLATWLATKSNRAATFWGLVVTLALLVGVLVVCGSGYRWPFAWRFHWAEQGWAWRWPLAVNLALIAGRCLTLVYDAWRERVARSDTDARPHATWHYRARATYQRLLGGALGGLIGVVTLWTLPGAFEWVNDKFGALLAGTSTAGLGALGGLMHFMIKEKSQKPGPTLADVRIIVSSLLLIYGSLLLAYWVASQWLVPIEPLAQLALLGVAVFVGGLINTNYFGLGRMYRDRLMEAFMPNIAAIRRNQWAPATDADETSLVDFRATNGGVVRPLHLVNCNVVMVDARSDKYRNRGGDSFVLSPLIAGSNATGWVATGHFGDGTLSLATAMAISGAAANPRAGVAGRGVTRNRLVSFLMSVLNARLGYWLPNPRFKRRAQLRFTPNLWYPGFQQGLFGRGLDERARFVELTDGGHFDNTALYELLRRRVKVIVLSEGGQDNDYQMDDIANAIEKARVDFGVHIRFDDPRFDLSGIRPANIRTPATRGYAVARIQYPKPAKRGEAPQYDTGVLLYLQPTRIADMRDDTDSYRRRHTLFPHEPTSDQFFGEEQLEAYRELGLKIAKKAIRELAVVTGEPSDLVSLLQGALALPAAVSNIKQAS